jgi:hypothetical protein
MPIFDVHACRPGNAETLQYVAIALDANWLPTEPAPKHSMRVYRNVLASSAAAAIREAQSGAGAYAGADEERRRYRLNRGGYLP